MRQLKYILPRKVLIRVYEEYVRQILEYTSDVWDGFSQECSNKLEMLQLEAARIVTGLPKFASKCSLYKETGWITLKERRKERKLCNFHKIINKTAPAYLQDLLPPSTENISHYNLRNKADLAIPKVRSTTLQNSFIFD